MTMHCLYCSKILCIGTPLQIDERERQHLFKILRARPGEHVNVIDGAGTIGEALITAGNNLILQSANRLPDPVKKLYLYLAVPKKQKMDQLLKQCAELGIWSVTPLLCERSVVLPDPENTPERWQNLLVEGCKQAKNPFLPQINCAMKLGVAIEQIRVSDYCAYYGEPGGNDNCNAEGLGCCNDLAWLVGPEGGFSDMEKNMMRHAQFRQLTLGSWVLRVETAAICGAAILINGS